MIFFTSDYHLFHEKMRVSRGFTTLDLMHYAIIEKANSKVQAKDTLYIVGDVAMSNNQDRVNDIIGAINCKNIVLIKGNHDNKKICRIESISAVYDYIEINHDGMHFVVCHYPFATWNRSHYGSFNIHGHSHGSYPGSSQQMDVGVDTNDMYPYSIDECITKMKTLPKHSGKDHHYKLGDM